MKRPLPINRKEEPPLPSGNRGVSFVFVIGIAPVAVIKGGSYKVVPSQTEVVLDGEGSINMNKKEITTEGLEFSWSCTQKKKPPTLCSKSLGTSSKLTIKSAYTEEGEKFELKLKVTSFRLSSATTQVIEVKKNAAMLEVTCEKNCPPATDIPNFRMVTFMRVKCVKNCQGVKNTDFEWTIKDKNGAELSFDYAKDTQFGRFGEKLVLEKKVLQPDEYSVVVKLKASAGRTGEVKMMLKYGVPPKIKACQVNPPQGNTMVQFGIMCTQEDPTKEYFYELLVRDAKDPSIEEVVKIGTTKEFMSTPVSLPPSEGLKFIVKVSAEVGPATEIEINPKVESLLKNSNEKMVEQFVKYQYDAEMPNGQKYPDNSISKMMISDQDIIRQMAMSRLKTLVDELVNVKSNDKDLNEMIEDLKYRATQDMLNSPLSSITDIIQMGDALTKMMSFKEVPKSDPLLTKFTTTVCKKMMDQHVELVKKEKFPLNLADKAKKVSSTLSQCLEVNTNPNFDVIQPIDQNITTEEPSFDVPEITENYPNYVDFSEEYYKNLDYLKESSYNIINATITSAKVMAMTTAVGEKFVESFGKKSATIVGKDYGKELVQKMVRSQGVTVIPSQDWVKSEHPFDILISTWSKDILWWNPAHTKISTDIANIQFWHSTCKDRVKKFKNPVKVFFEIRKNASFKPHIIEDTFIVPEKYSMMSENELNYHIKVRRVQLARRLALYINFHNLTKTDAFDIVITKFRFPTMKDFAENTTVITSDFNSTLSLVNEEDYDIWGYIGILANRDVVVKNNLNKLSYHLSFIAAGKEGNVSVINCKCYNLSIIAGHIHNIKALSQEIMIPVSELELQSSFVVFVTVAVTVGLFCLLSVFVLGKTKIELFYLADNNKKHFFSYLIIVKTGAKRHSGTSSNITIKLVGKKRSSEPHVLNYPDPKMRLLQKYGEDMFVLTTEGHLGELTHIELWNDCQGPNPDWSQIKQNSSFRLNLVCYRFCKSIRIYDMQEHTEWVFKIKKRLTVINGNNPYVSAKPITKEPRRKRILNRFRFNNTYHTWWLFHNEENYSYMKKLTGILSTLLTTYVTALILFGVPKLQLRDSLDAHHYYVDTYVVFAAFLSSFPSFMFHNVIAWCFRLSALQFSKHKQEGKMSFSVTLICWLLLITLIISSLTFLLIFGFWLPMKKSLIWLTACVIGVGFNILFYESIFVFIQSFFCKLELAIEEQRLVLYKQFGDLLLRPYFQHLYKPLTNYQVKEKKMFLQRRREVIAEFEDLMMFSIYIIILYVVVLVNKDSFIVSSKKVMLDVMDGLHTRSMDFYRVGSFEEIYNYINTTLIPAIQPLKWYGSYVISDPGLMIDLNNKYIGIARFRQQRMSSNLCRIAEEMEFTNMTCWPEFSVIHTETRTFGYGWGRFSTYLEFDRLKSIWEYSDQHQTGSLPTFGEFSTYSGGGYIAYLGRTLYNSYANFRKLLSKFWIDDKTRSIFIEFLTYNVNYNVFNSVKMLYEQSATGFIFSDVEVYAVRMIFVENEIQKISVIFFFLFIAWVGMLFFKQSLGIVKKFRTFYKDAWFLIDFLIIFMSVVCISIFMIRSTMVGKYFKELETKRHNEFLSYFYLFYIEDFLTIFAATLVCIATVRLWKFLRFGMMFRILERTLSLAATPLLTVALGFSFILTGFSMTIALLYGNEFERTNTVLRIARLLTTVSLKANELSLPDFLIYYSAFFYFTIYGIILVVTIFTFIMVIVMAYAEAQMEFSSETDVYNIKHYVLERMKYFPKFIKYKCIRLKGGQMRKDLVQPKTDKFLYSNCFSVATNRMKKMEHVTQCIIRNMQQSVIEKIVTEYDTHLMLKLCRQFITKTEEKEEFEVFFKGRMKGKKIGMIDEKRVIKVAHAVNLLLQEKQESLPVVRRKSSMVFQQCVEMIEQKQTTLTKCDLLLKLLLHKIDRIELDWKKTFR
ncbi:polycystic kidney disease protein 1-like 2, partial [Asbolus verrucosus]